MPVVPRLSRRCFIILFCLSLTTAVVTPGCCGHLLALLSVMGRGLTILGS